MAPIGSVGSFGYYPNYNYNNARSNVTFKQNNIDLSTKKEIEELKKDHKTTKNLLYGVTGLATLVIGYLLFKNNSLAKQAKTNLSEIKTKLTTLKNDLKKQNSQGNGTTVNSSDVLDLIVDALLLTH